MKKYLQFGLLAVILTNISLAGILAMVQIFVPMLDLVINSLECVFLIVASFALIKKADAFLTAGVFAVFCLLAKIGQNTLHYFITDMAMVTDISIILNIGISALSLIMFWHFFSGEAVIADTASMSDSARKLRFARIIVLLFFAIQIALVAISLYTQLLMTPSYLEAAASGDVQRIQAEMMNNPNIDKLQVLGITSMVMILPIIVGYIYLVFAQFRAVKELSNAEKGIAAAAKLMQQHNEEKQPKANEPETTAKPETSEEEAEESKETEAIEDEIDNEDDTTQSK